MPESYHRQNLRSELIDEGRRLLLAEGYPQFSLRKLASRLGVSHNAPYRHFASREELIRAIVNGDMARFNAAMAAGVESVDDPYERLYKLGEAYVFFFLDNPEVLVLLETLPGQLASQGEALASLFSGSETEGKRGDSGLHETAGPDNDGYALLEEATRPFAARFPGLSEREIILGYWAKVHGLASLLVNQKDFLPPEGREERVRTLVRTPF
jgi:Transcriptional regulator